jgi:hypothetical protein
MRGWLLGVYVGGGTIRGKHEGFEAKCAEFGSLGCRESSVGGKCGIMTSEKDSQEM